MVANIFLLHCRVLESLKAEILETRKKTVSVNEQLKKSQMQANEEDAAKEIAELKLKIQVCTHGHHSSSNNNYHIHTQRLQKKNSATIRDLNRHPIACGDIVRKTIARITEEYKERKRNISETCGPHHILQCNYNCT